jgi:hypothetical protein
MVRNPLAAIALLRSEGMASAPQGVDLLIVDNISTLCWTGSDNSAGSWTSMQEWILRLRRRGIAVLLMHHSGKSGGQRGTSRREDVLDTVIGLRRPEDYEPLAALRNRPGRALSGGEQLALARCLVGRPSVVLLDEPSEGIQPSIVEQIARHLHDLSVRQKLAILLVEQDLQFVASVAQRVYVMRKGRLVSEIAPGDLTDPAIVKQQLGI